MKNPDNILPNQVSEAESTESDNDENQPSSNDREVLKSGNEADYFDQSDNDFETHSSEPVEHDSSSDYYSSVDDEIESVDDSDDEIESVDYISSDQNSSAEGESSLTEELDDLSVVSTELHAKVDQSSSNNEPLGRGMRNRQPNTRYYNEDFQFLQTSFQDLSQDAREEFLSYAMDEFRTYRKTHLLERYLTGVVLLQMSASAGLRKHGKEAEKALLKEFQQFKGMDVMDVLDPDLLSDEQKEEALGMVNILQEKRDHTPQNPHLKIRGCANGKKQRKRYTREETTSPTSGIDSILLTLMIAAMEGRDVAIADIVGAYLHAKMDEFVAMRIVGREAELMCELNPEWKVHLRYDKRKRAILYVRLKKALWVCEVCVTLV